MKKERKKKKGEIEYEDVIETIIFNLLLWILQLLHHRDASLIVAYNSFIYNRIDDISVIDANGLWHRCREQSSDKEFPSSADFSQEERLASRATHSTEVDVQRRKIRATTNSKSHGETKGFNVSR